MQAPKLSGPLLCNLRLRVRCLKATGQRAEANAGLDGFAAERKQCTRKKLSERSFRLSMANQVPGEWDQVAIPRTKIAIILIDALEKPCTPGTEEVAGPEPDKTVLTGQTTRKC